jgi:hypothetical protein
MQNSNSYVNAASLHSEAVSEESSNNISNDGNGLLCYLDQLLFFFSKNLEIGLRNEILAKEFNKKLKIKLFDIYDDEVSFLANHLYLMFYRLR